MTPSDIRQRIAEIQARAEKATPGKWDVLKEGSYFIRSEARTWVGMVNASSASFIAHARADVPWLCEQLLSYMATLEEMEA